MPNTKSAKKRLRQNKKRRLRNRMYVSRMRTESKKLLKLIEEKKLEEARQQFILCSKIIQRAAVRGIIHKNEAARRQSRLAKKLNALEKELAQENK
ncbi:MAG TPA: 30S ribosomal protein S20 [Desulfurobacteriaceae bacterium]|nr:30S ribosomal protein S20 [Desulfurobacteriaceae bacterium]